MPDARETSGKYVQQETAQKFLRADGHLSLLVVVGVVFPTERDRAIFEGNQSVVGNRYSVRISTEILQDMLRPPERLLGVNHPFLAPQLAQPCTKQLGLSQQPERTMEVELVLPEQTF